MSQVLIFITITHAYKEKILIQNSNFNQHNTILLIKQKTIIPKIYFLTTQLVKHLEQTILKKVLGIYEPLEI